ncbi:MFS transporter [Candidatus Tisiphia endosymbiont of Ditula angustiorana]|uniref:MFS transporter n=1 Tax=Candidatus Tisiphia endosymbiont of Ditula angustiorana TaxID=3066272 RepID=UPI00312C922A
MSKFVRADGRVIYTQTSLTRQQKEAFGLLSIGTFLEYFDLMLYVHMAVLLNELFFPKEDPQTASILSATAFCSTFIFRPIGALIFGWIGDNLGRKVTVVITTLMMAISCFVMANLPTYEQIGITAAWLVTICRMAQGMASMGEVTGAELYITEMTKPPIRYFLVALIGTVGIVGTVSALGIASIVTSHGLNWRLAFWVGMVIAVVGSIARTTLREAPEFIDAKRRITEAFQHANKDSSCLKQHTIWKEKIPKKTLLSYFLIQCSWPVIFYFVYIYCTNILKDLFHFTSAQIIFHNFIISIGHLLGNFIFAYLSYKIYPLKILRTLFIIFTIGMLCSPLLLSNIKTPFHLLLIQLFFIMFGLSESPAMPIFFKHFPVLRRFTCSSFSFALSRAFMYVIVSFGLSYLIQLFGNYGLLVIMIPNCLGYRWGLSHFERLEKNDGNYQ